jgi:hypothetical protein
MEAVEASSNKKAFAKAHEEENHNDARDVIVANGLPPEQRKHAHTAGNQPEHDSKLFLKVVANANSLHLLERAESLPEKGVGHHQQQRDRQHHHR